ncbi:hypothetical protein BDN70DRAFT_876456 [Pholiota conissans]|uniref:Uncharacterized protein n=1 Tax=Pholiota conissans TaxID=109636 RepID=A0A9P5Z8D5_9AGAR|nr:hypothetical protein BDN70DRAFT_876456 [Pholiota conissans]
MADSGSNDAAYISPAHLSHRPKPKTNGILLRPIDPLEPLPLLPSEVTALSLIKPGVPYAIAPTALPTAQAILDGSYENTADTPGGTVVVVPRLPKHSGRPSFPMVSFCVRGQAGLRLRDLREVGGDGRFVLDGGNDEVWEERMWKKTTLTIDWPGITSSGEHMPCFDSNGRPCTRTEVAKMVAEHLYKFFEGKAYRWGPQEINADTVHWKLKRLNYPAVRVLGISYYRKTWVPVLAVDV